jgi:hypothetical protein
VRQSYNYLLAPTASSKTIAILNNHNNFRLIYTNALTNNSKKPGHTYSHDHNLLTATPYIAQLCLTLTQPKKGVGKFKYETPKIHLLNSSSLRLCASA